LNKKGEVIRVCANNMQRDSAIRASSAEQVKDVYRALALFDKMLYDKKNQVIYKMNDGEKDSISTGTIPGIDYG
jgi:hypothetical protein